MYRKAEEGLDFEFERRHNVSMRSLRTDVGNRLTWMALTPYLPEKTKLESVRRTANDQLFLIVQRARNQGYVFKRNPVVGDIASWEEAWKLVNTHTNPIARPGRSMHQRGIAYDLSGPDLNAIFAALKRAAADGRIHLAKSSPNNPRMEGRCVHVEIDHATLDCEPFAIV